ncbi:hypothetical protein Nepgr_019735 [Nepenthes gracilis]|uniref:MADS-box domain-containing protein n=1 Tax=Nepenthes gracilis TaxID=150966 RepID=A0AAD3XVC1_NEPGR|nr:hypothetical protein Nepgr_019735 [Nepenthes gracilis]
MLPLLSNPSLLQRIHKLCFICLPGLTFALVMAPEKKSKGRQKVEIVKMEKDANLQVTFSKRRAGLFKKASELCTLCGVEAAIIVFSPGKKAFSFGHPSVDAVTDRYLVHNSSSNVNTHQSNETHHDSSLEQLNLQLSLLNHQLEAERKHGEELNEIRKAKQTQFWWQAPVEKLELQQLEELKQALVELKGKMMQHINKLLMQASNPPSLLGFTTTEGFSGPVVNYPNDLGHGF